MFVYYLIEIKLKKQTLDDTFYNDFTVTACANAHALKLKRLDLGPSDICRLYFGSVQTVSTNG